MRLPWGLSAGVAKDGGLRWMDGLAGVRGPAAAELGIRPEAVCGHPRGPAQGHGSSMWRGSPSPRVSVGTSSLLPRALVPIWWAQTHPPDRIWPVPTAHQSPPWAASRGPLDAPGCPSRHVPLSRRGSAGASAEGLPGAGAPAAARLALPPRALARRPGGSCGAECCSVLVLLLEPTRSPETRAADSRAPTARPPPRRSAAPATAPLSTFAPTPQQPRRLRGLAAPAGRGPGPLAFGTRMTRMKSLMPTVSLCRRPRLRRLPGEGCLSLGLAGGSEMPVKWVGSWESGGWMMGRWVTDVWKDGWMDDKSLCGSLDDGWLDGWWMVDK